MKEQIELKPCPFCGGEAKYKYQNVYMSKAVFVHCKDCNARVVEYYMGMDGAYIRGDGTTFTLTEDEAKGKAAERWNRRATDERED